MRCVNTRQCWRAASLQCGAATLTVSLAVLLLGTLIVLGVSQAVLMEQKVANNSVRAAQAFEAAEAGLNAALDYVYNEPDRDWDGSLDPVFDTNGDGTGDTHATSIGSGSVAVATEDLSDGAMTRIAVTAHGYSDDRSARRTLARTLVVLDPIPNLPRIPLIAGGAIHIHGMLEMRNVSGLDAIWAGGSMLASEGAALTIALPDAADAAYPECLAREAGCALRTSSSTGDASIVANDTTLDAMPADELFRATFGLAPATFATSLPTRKTTPARFDQDTELTTREVIYVEGNTTIGSVTLGCKTALTRNATCDDTARRPVVLIIAGDAAFAGDAHLYGLLFVGGAATITGALHVHGAIVATNTVVVHNDAELDIVFDKAVLAALHGAGPLTPLAGTWNEG